MKVLVCGGAGYIGSHTVVELLAAGHEVVILDSFANSSKAVPDRLRQITGIEIPVIEMDIRDPRLKVVFIEGNFDAVIHFAALKSVGESVKYPLDYYDVNVAGTIHLLRTMIEHDVPRLVFSSSATVYGNPDSVPIAEDAPLRTTNPYGETKLVCEQMIRSFCMANPTIHAAILRYFNPVGAHESGLIGEDPSGVPNNLMPYISQVAVGKRSHLNVFGDDYDTRDGTGVRDYIHVMDLAAAHVAALNSLDGNGSFTVNVGTGEGYSVLELLRTFEQVTGRKVPYEVTARREGDVAECYANPALARNLMGWIATRGIIEMCRDTWNWQSRNPDGFRNC